MGPVIYRVLALISFVFAFVSFVNSASGITGFAVVDDVGVSTSAIFGIVFSLVAVFILLLLARKQLKEEGLHKYEEEENLLDDDSENSGNDDVVSD